MALRISRLQAWTDWTPSSRTHRWKRRKKSNAVARAWGWFIGVLLALTVTGVLVWEIAEHVHESVARGNSVGEAALSMIRGSALAPWQQDVLDSLDKSAEEVGVGQTTQAAIGVDRVSELLKTARLNSQHCEPDFFQMALTGMDRVWNQRPDNDRLFQHVTNARVELAALRVAQDASSGQRPAGSAAAGAHDPDWIPAVHNIHNNGVAASASAAAAGEQAAGRVSITAPREIAANSTLNPQSLGGDYLDATRMTGNGEILMLPAQGSSDNNVRVENLTIAGGSQRLEAIHWTNVTFVGTEVRYEKGPLDLENVHFVRCTFRFAPDVGASRLANAIALGQTSFTAE